MDFGWASISFELDKKKDESKSTSKKKDSRVLDFTTSTSINKTVKMIRNDMRLYRISYYDGMVILIKARNNLRKMLKEEKSKDKEEKDKNYIKNLERRIQVIERQIRYTKKIMREKYGNPETLLKNQVLTKKEIKSLNNKYRPIQFIKA